MTLPLRLARFIRSNSTQQPTSTLDSVDRMMIGYGGGVIISMSIFTYHSGKTALLGEQERIGTPLTKYQRRDIIQSECWKDSTLYDNTVASLCFPITMPIFATTKFLEYIG